MKPVGGERVAQPLAHRLRVHEGPQQPLHQMIHGPLVAQRDHQVDVPVVDGRVDSRRLQPRGGCFGRQGERQPSAADQPQLQEVAFIIATSVHGPRDAGGFHSVGEHPPQ